MFKSITTICLVMLLLLASCGGGGTIVRGDGTGIGDGGPVEDVSLDSQHLPGTVAVEASSNSFDLAMESGAPVTITNHLSESGRYELKSELLFTE